MGAGGTLPPLRAPHPIPPRSIPIRSTPNRAPDLRQLEESAGNLGAAREVYKRGLRSKAAQVTRGRCCCGGGWRGCRRLCRRPISIRYMRGFHYTSLYVDHSIVLYAAQVQLVSAAAALEARVGDLGAARRIFAGGAERPSLTRAEQADLLLSWSDIEIRAGRPPKARKLLHRALRAQPTSARVALGLAALDWREGRVRQARALA